MTETQDQQSPGAKEAIFSAIRKSLEASAPFDADHQNHHRPKVKGEPEPTRDDSSQETLVGNFRASLEAVGGHFYLVSNAADAGETIRSIIGKIGAKRIAVSDSDLVRDATAGITGIEFSREVEVADLFAFDVGITSAQWAIAETGTFVLESDREKHRLISLVPPVHLSLITACNVRQTLGEILELTRPDLSRTMTFITGASRTSDIELTLAVGVHGPGELHVIVVNEV